MFRLYTFSGKDCSLRRVRVTTAMLSSAGKLERSTDGCCVNQMMTLAVKLFWERTNALEASQNFLRSRSFSYEGKGIEGNT